MVKILPVKFTETGMSPYSSTQILPPPERSQIFAPATAHPKKEQELLRIFLSNLAHEYRQVLFLLPTKTLFPTFSTVTEILQQSNFPAVFNLIDSHSLGYGLGWLIQSCVTVLKKSENLSEVIRFLHNKIPQVYTLIYLPSLTPLIHTHLLDPDQALIGDLLGIRPLLLLENDQVIPYLKTRSFKNLVDSMVEYAQEFRQIEYIGLHFGISIGVLERRQLQHRLQSLFARCYLDIQVMNPSLNRILGDQSICMILIEGDK